MTAGQRGKLPFDSRSLTPNDLASLTHQASHALTGLVRFRLVPGASMASAAVVVDVEADGSIAVSLGRSSGFPLLIKRPLSLVLAPVME